MGSFLNDLRSVLLLCIREKGAYALIGSELAFYTSPVLSRIPRPSFAKSPTGIASGPQSLRVILLDGFLSLLWSFEVTLRVKKRSSNTRSVYFLYLPFIVADCAVSGIPFQSCEHPPVLCCNSFTDSLAILHPRDFCAGPSRYCVREYPPPGSTIQSGMSRHPPPLRNFSVATTGR